MKTKHKDFTELNFQYDFAQKVVHIEFDAETIMEGLYKATYIGKVLADINCNNKKELTEINHYYKKQQHQPVTTCKSKSVKEMNKKEHSNEKH